MNQKCDAFSQTADSMRKLCTFALAGAEELLGLQLDCAEQFFTCHHKQIRIVLKQMDDLPAPAQWPETMRSGADEATVVMRDAFVSAIDLQMKSFQWTQKIASDMQKLMSAAISEQVAAMGSSEAFARHSGKTIFLRQSSAA